jgi:hypothetical protein
MALTLKQKMLQKFFLQAACKPSIIDLPTALLKFHLTTTSQHRLEINRSYSLQFNSLPLLLLHLRIIFAKVKL